MIADTVGLWGIPVNRFRIFKVGFWHIVWPNQIFAGYHTSTYDEARQIVLAAIKEADTP